MSSTRTARDLAADSPLSYAELRAANVDRTLAARLAAMTPRERVGAAALVADVMGRDLSNVLAVFGALIEAEAVVMAVAEEGVESADELLAEPDAAEVEAEYRNTPSDPARCTIQICAVTGDHVIADQLGRFIRRGTLVDMEAELAELQAPPALRSCHVQMADGTWATLGPSGKRLYWAWGGSAAELRKLIASRAA